MSTTLQRKPWPSKTGRTGPLPALAKIGRLGHDAYPCWADHQHVGRDDDGERVFVVCPYQVGDDAVRDLDDLRRLGWRVRVHAASVYGLGTMQIELRPPR